MKELQEANLSIKTTRPRGKGTGGASIPSQKKSSSSDDNR